MAFAASAAAASAVVTTGGALFDYNRKNYLYDRQMRQEIEYHIMDFSISQADLWRDDVREIVELTLVKMDTYLIVNAVQLGFVVMALCEGRLEEGTPTWLIGLHITSLSSAFIYLVMSVWLAMHASVAAKSYEVRMLTQHVRLPVPSWSQLEASRTYGSTYEKVEARQMFRMPFIQGTQEAVRESAASASQGYGAGDDTSLFSDHDLEPALSDGDEDDWRGGGPEGRRSADPWGLERTGDGIYELDAAVRADPRKLRHVKLVREAMQYWNSYDGFSRVSMTLGTLQLINTLCYYIIGYVLHMNHAVFATWMGICLFVAIEIFLVRLDLSITHTEYIICIVLVSTAPILSAIVAYQWSMNSDIGVLWRIIFPCTPFFVQAAWTMFIVYLCRNKDVYSAGTLPQGFRSILYIDIYGWIKTKISSSYAKYANYRRRSHEGVNKKLSSHIGPGKGPGIQAVRYTHGTPTPLRPEELANSALPSVDPTPEDMFPSSFVQGERASAAGKSEPVNRQPGWSAGGSFRALTALLALLWIMTGILEIFDCMDLTWFTFTTMSGRYADWLAVSSQAAPEVPTVDLTGGLKLYTLWPHEDGGAHLHNLACDDDSGTVVALSKFDYFVGRIGYGSSVPAVNFSKGPDCPALSGIELQDVAVSCNKAGGGKCSAHMLHQNGMQFVSCPFQTPTPISLLQTVERPVETRSVEWITDPTLDEQLTGFTLAPKCMNEGQKPGSMCAYMMTDRHRILEMQLSGNKYTNATRKWHTSRVFKESSGTETSTVQFINGRHLSLLRNGRILDSLNFQDGTVQNHISLPDGEWCGACSAGGRLYLLSQGPYPALFSFNMPEVFKRPVVTKHVGPRARSTKEAFLSVPG